MKNKFGYGKNIDGSHGAPTLSYDLRIHINLIKTIFLAFLSTSYGNYPHKIYSVPIFLQKILKKTLFF